MSTPRIVKSLGDRLKDKEFVICAEGYLFDFERRGYLQAGAFVPEVVLEHPDMVRMLHEEFVHAGSDIVQAFTYYAHREKLRIIGREHDLEKIQKKALLLARCVADDTGTLMAGNISNTTIFDPNNPEKIKEVEAIFREQVQWAEAGGADFIIAETYNDYGEANLALQSILKYGKGLPAVIAFAPPLDDKTYDGVPLDEACRRLEADGASVVGLNCSRGPDTMIENMKRIRKACKGPICCLPVPYRTTDAMPAMQDLKDTRTGEKSFPDQLEPWLCSRADIRKFTEQMKEIGVQYIGVCCGNRPFYIREMAETLGRTPPASRFTSDMTRHLSRIGGDEHDHSRQNWNKDRTWDQTPN